MRYSVEDFYDCAPPRIIGTETEYGCPPLMGLRGISDESRTLKYGAHGFTTNGSRIYRDCGQSTEYATPESRGPLQATCTDHSGIRVIQAMYEKVTDLDRLARTLKAAPQRRSGAVDSTGAIVTKGTHHNFLAPVLDRGYGSMLGALVVSHLVSRQPWCGTGLLVSGDQSFLTQKSTGIGETFVHGFGQHRTTEGCKPCVAIQSTSAGNTDAQGRDKIHDHRFGIIEVRFADPHMFPQGTFLALGTTSLVLRLLEHEKITAKNIADFCFKRPVDTLRAINSSKDPYLTDTYETDAGKQMTALELQYRLAELALDLASEITLPEDEQTAAQSWHELVQLLRQMPDNDDPSLWQVEHIAKARLLARKYPEGATAMQAQAFDLQWTTTQPGKSIGLLAAKKFDPLWPKIQDDIKYFMESPPSTRAAQRAEVVKNGGRIDSWSEFSMSAATISHHDPYGDHPK